jgi:D-arabinose 1-dehydrogenase-like Zn-dependent alcohol dehydrogenase
MDHVHTAFVLSLGSFTFLIPDNIKSEVAAPMLCAGLTVYSPLVRLGAGPGKKVAIVGMGGKNPQWDTLLR